MKGTQASQGGDDWAGPDHLDTYCYMLLQMRWAGKAMGSVKQENVGDGRCLASFFIFNFIIACFISCPASFIFLRCDSHTSAFLTLEGRTHCFVVHSQAVQASPLCLISLLK